jgi:hypothetical protein
VGAEGDDGVVALGADERDALGAEGDDGVVALCAEGVDGVDALGADERDSRAGVGLRVRVDVSLNVVAAGDPVIDDTGADVGDDGRDVLGATSLYVTFLTKLSSQ